MPIPTESIDVDMTADHDQEHLLAPLTNLGPSEQLRLLRARIVQLESQQTTPASSCPSFELVAQNENEMRDAVDTLCSQTDEIVPNNGKEAMADQQEEEEQTKADQTEHLREKITQIELEVMNMKQWKAELLAKIEELEFKQKADQQKENCAKIDEHLREKIKQIELELKDMKQQNVDQKEHRAKIDEAIKATTALVKKHKTLQTKMKNELQQTIEELTEAEEGNGKQLNVLHEIVVKMKEYQKEQQLCIIDLQKKVALLGEPQNRWNFYTSHQSLTLSRLIAKVTDKHDWGHFSVFAALPIPKKDFGIFYYEVTIFGHAFGVCIGLAPNQMPTDEWVGHYEGTYAYCYGGQIWGHAVERCRHDSNGRSGIYGKPSFNTGDVIGCGVNLATRQIIYTKNGERLETTGLFVDSAAELSDLFPCVTLYCPDYESKIEANFGPNFKWKF